MGKLDDISNYRKNEQRMHKIEKRRGGDPIQKSSTERQKAPLEFIAKAAMERQTDRGKRLEERNKRKLENDPRTRRLEERNVKKGKEEKEDARRARKRKPEAEAEEGAGSVQPPRKKSKVGRGKEPAKDVDRSDISESDSWDGSDSEADFPREGLKETKEIVIKTFQPEEPFRLRNCSVDSVRSIKGIARGLHRALEADAPPEHIYLQLFLLLGEHPAIRKLEKRFKEIDSRDKEVDGRDLETALAEHFTKHFGDKSLQLRFALQLIKKGEIGTNRAIDEDLSEARDGDRAKRLRNALVTGRVEEAYAILAPFQRCTERLCKFNEAYKRNNSDIGLQADIKQYLTRDSQKFTLYLIGEGGLRWGDDLVSQERLDSDQSRDPMELLDPPDHLREIPYLETMVIPEHVAERLAMAAAQLTYQPDGEKPDRNPVPYDEAFEGCNFRSHLVAQAFKELGFASGLIFAYSVRGSDKKAGLYLRSDLACEDDSYPSTGHHWQYHTACWILVQTRSGKIERRIVDPAMDRNKPNCLWTEEEWMRKMGKNPDSYVSKQFEAWKKVLEEKRKKYLEDNTNDEDDKPTDQTYVFTASRNHMGVVNLVTIKAVSRPDVMPDEYSNEKYKNEGRNILNGSVEWLPNCRIARLIREARQKKANINDDGAIKLFRDIDDAYKATMNEFHLPTPPGTTFRSGFSSDFPNTYEDFIKYLSKCDISSAIVTSFEESLSDHNYRIAREIQKEMRKTETNIKNDHDAKALAKKLRAGEAKTPFKSDFPDIYDRFITYLEDESKRDISSATVATFKEGLSGTKEQEQSLPGPSSAQIGTSMS